MPVDAEGAPTATIEAWRSWSAQHNGYDGPYREEIARARLVIQGMTYQPTGAVVAAATTSLPEVPVSCRLSDDVQILFGVEGERQLAERELDHLEGFAGSRPVRVGNAAWEQRQPDAGIWEERDAERHHTLSKVMCWVALDRGLRLADRLGDGADPERWRAERDEIRETVLREAYNNERAAFTGVLGGDELDAAVLLLPLVGFIDAADDRMVATVRALQETLGADGLMHRVERIHETGAFLPTTSWLAAVQAQAGDADAARATIDRGLACANDLGLLAELGDPETSRPLGNTPQVLSHVALISAVMRLPGAEAEEAPS